VKIVSFDDEKDRKNYGVNTLLEDTKGLHDEEGIEILAVVYKKNNGKVGIGTTEGNNAEIVGLMEMAKLQYLEDDWR
jgi:hypothetical protein